MASSSAPRYEFLLVARHGSRTESLGDVCEVAEQLRDTLDDLRTANPAIDIQVSRVEHSDSDDARSAARIFFDQLVCGDGTRPCSVEFEPDIAALGLGPKRITSYTDRDSANTKVAASWDAVEERLAFHRRHQRPECRVNALMLVGNQPAVDWFLAEGEPLKLWPIASINLWPGGKIDFRPISVAPAEVVCLARRVPSRWWHAIPGVPRRWHLWWVMTPTAQSAIEELRQKVQSKMTALSVLAGFTAAMLTTVAVNLAGPDVGDDRPGDRAFLLAAVAIFSLSTVVLLVALLAYDRLMMPHRFWGTVRSRGGPNPLRSRTVVRPPSSAGWVLYQHSVKIWQWVIGALGATGIGVLLVIAATARVCGANAWRNQPLSCPNGSVQPEIVGVGVIVLLIAAAALLAWWRMRPELGTED